MSALKAKGRKIFEIPICTICLDPLTKDLASFGQCGHVFHYNCAINCHSNSRKCPNCRIRSTDIQSLHYQVDEITGIDEQMQNILTNLSDDQKDHMAKLLVEHEKLLHENQKCTQINQILEEKCTKQQQQIEQLNKENQRLTEYNKNLDEKKRELRMKLRTAELSYDTIFEENKQNQELLENYTKQIDEFHYLKEIKQALDQTIIDDQYIKSLRQKSHQEQAQQLYDIYSMKHSQYKKLQKENEQIQQELEEMRKKYQQTKRIQEDMIKENQNLKDYMNNKKKPVSLQDLNNSQEETKMKRQPITNPIKFGSQQIRKQPVSMSLLQNQNFIKKN